jgi:hypothetical protein
MDKLEHYVEQVCRSIGGSRALRQHVRQELREHLLDAVAQHRSAGLSEEQALDRALEEFGKPDEMRSELEATHGHRMLAVVIDRALQWKEMTMRAKWLWTTWAYIAVAVVIALEVMFVTFMVMMIVPKFQKLMQDGYIDPAIIDEQGMSWMISSLQSVNYATQNYTTFLVLGAAVLWGLFEWRVKSENKPFMRLAALGTVAIVLMAMVMFIAGTLLVSFCVGAPAMGALARPFAIEQVAAIETSADAIDGAIAKQDWNAMQKTTDEASNAITRLMHGPAIKSLTARNEPSSVDELRDVVSGASDDLAVVQQAIRQKDVERLKAALEKFRKSFEPVREAAKSPAQ